MTVLPGSAIPLMVGVVSPVVLLLPGAEIVGAVPPATAVVGVSGLATLLMVLASPGTGAVVALNCGCVPTVLISGVAGTLKVLLLPGAIGPALMQVTVWLAVVQLQPLLLKLAGADTPAGRVTVLVSGPVAGPWPLLVIVMGTLLA